MRGSKVHFHKLKMVTGKVFSHLCYIISLSFCTFATKGARDAFQKTIFLFDIPRKGKRTETFYTRGKNIVWPSTSMLSIYFYVQRKHRQNQKKA
jgi:hypothetical protein